MQETVGWVSSPIRDNDHGCLTRTTELRESYLNGEVKITVERIDPTGKQFTSKNICIILSPTDRWNPMLGGHSEVPCHHQSPQQGQAVPLL